MKFRSSSTISQQKKKPRSRDLKLNAQCVTHLLLDKVCPETMCSFSYIVTQLNAEFQRISRTDKKAFLNEQCKEQENNRMGKTRDLFKKM